MSLRNKNNEGGDCMGVHAQYNFDASAVQAIQALKSK